MKGMDAVGSHAPPLPETLELVDPEKYYFGLQPRPSEGAYETVGSLVRDGGQPLTRLMERARTKGELGVQDSALAMLGGYAWGVGGPAIACYVLSRRVPDVSPENVALRFDANGGISEAALLRQRFAVLPSDPASDHPDAVVLDGEAEMLGWMRERLAAGIEPLVEAVRGHVRLGRRAAWVRVSDYAASAFLMVGWDSGDQARNAADAEAFVTAPGSPLRGRTGFFTVEGGGRRGAYLTRGVCCQIYKDPRYGNCDSCPLLSQEDRERRALTDLAARG